MLWRRAFAIWLLLMPAGSVHGTLRILLLARRIGDFRARQVAVLTGSALILAITFMCMFRFANISAR